MTELLKTPVKPDYEGLLACIRREGTPKRVYNTELFVSKEIQAAVCERFDLLGSLDINDPFFFEKRQIEVQRFLGYDYVKSCPENSNDFAHNEDSTEDTAELSQDNSRTFVNEHRGPIATWEEFEAYKWPDPSKFTTRQLEWYQENLPDDMCIIGGIVGSFAEELSWLMGYETLCYALYDQRDLVQAIADKLLTIFSSSVKDMLQFDRVKAVWGSDDMGFKTGTLISPDDLRSFVLPGHKKLVQMTHDAGHVYLLHSCGKLDKVMDDLIDDVGLDAKHSYEDTIESVQDVKSGYGKRIAMLGGIDMDFLCRSNEDAIRQRVRETLDVCQPGGGYCLGTGNTVANYIPLENYLIMLDEGRQYVL